VAIPSRGELTASFSDDNTSDSTNIRNYLIPCVKYLILITITNLGFVGVKFGKCPEIR
jgi:hypothetical protein